MQIELTDLGELIVDQFKEGLITIQIDVELNNLGVEYYFLHYLADRCNIKFTIINESNNNLKRHTDTLCIAYRFQNQEEYNMGFMQKYDKDVQIINDKVILTYTYNGHFEVKQFGTTHLFKLSHLLSKYFIKEVWV